MSALRRLVVSSVALLALGAALPVGVTSAAPRRVSAPPRPTVAYVESYYSDPDTDAGRFVIDATIPLPSIDVSAAGGDRYFDISIGDFDFGGYLSDDPNWAPGKTTATLTDVGDAGDVQLVARLRWTSTRLTVRVVAVTGDDIQPIVCDTYAGDETAAINDPDMDPPADIEFGDVDVSWECVRSVGVVRSWTRHDDDFSSVRMHGRAAQ
jgi:hypothetical protein